MIGKIFSGIVATFTTLLIFRLSYFTGFYVFGLGITGVAFLIFFLIVLPLGIICYYHLTTGIPRTHSFYIALLRYLTYAALLLACGCVFYIYQAFTVPGNDAYSGFEVFLLYPLTIVFLFVSWLMNLSIRKHFDLNPQLDLWTARLALWGIGISILITVFFIAKAVITKDF